MRFFVIYLQINLLKTTKCSPRFTKSNDKSIIILKNFSKSYQKASRMCELRALPVYHSRAKGPWQHRVRTQQSKRVIYFVLFCFCLFCFFVFLLFFLCFFFNRSHAYVEIFLNLVAKEHDQFLESSSSFRCLLYRRYSTVLSIEMNLVIDSNRYGFY